MKTHFYTDIEFEQPEENRPLIACNMVTSLDGKVTSDGTQPKSLGSDFDLKTMGIIRSHFDAVLAGGNTIRLHPYYLGVPKELASQPLTVLLTKSGRLDSNTPLFTNPPLPPIIITSKEGARNLPPAVKAASRVEILENATPHQIISLLNQKYQVGRLLVEGGPSVNYQFMQFKVLDELFLTLYPSLIGKKTDLNLAAGERVLDRAQRIQLVSTNQHEDELFLRYRIKW